MHLVNFFSEKKSFQITKKKKIRLLVKEICKNEGYVLSFLNYIFCTDKYLLKINQKYLSNNNLTDIITFDFSEKKNTAEGDLYISVERVKENSKKYKVLFTKELIRVIIHGLLHLAGYNDGSEKEKKRMRSLENKYLSLYENL